MSFITANAPPTRPPISRSGNSVMRTQRSSPSSLALAPLVRDRRAGERALDVALHLGERLRRHELRSAWPSRSSAGDADPVGERLVREAELELAVEVEDRHADAVGDEAQPVLALAGLELEPLQVIDVAVGDEEAAHRALRRLVGVVVDVDPDRRPAGDDELPLEAGALAVERGVDVGVVELVDLAAERPR